MHGLLAIFDMVCNRVFPDDARLAVLDRIPNTRPMTPEQVRTYLGKDPGRGWINTNGQSAVIITVEAPPIHTCAIRMPRTDGMIDEARWRELVDAAEARAGGGFTRLAPRSFVVGDVRSNVIGDQRSAPDGSAEAFYLMRTEPVDPAKAPAYGIELRLVHQMVAARAR